MFLKQSYTQEGNSRRRNSKNNLEIDPEERLVTDQSLKDSDNLGDGNK